MPAKLPTKPIGFTIGAPNADVNLSCFLDYTCPFSGKMYKAITEIVCPAYADKSFSFTFYNQVQPWHPQSTTVHEASLAVAQLSGTDAFFKYSTKLFECAEEFFDTAVFDMPRSQVIDKLCKLAEETETAKAEEMRPLISMVTNTDKKNPGTPMNQELKFSIKFARQNGIHVSPTTMLNGLVFDSSSSWGLEDFKKVLDPLFE